MKRLHRGPAPAPLGDSADDRKLRAKWYANLRDKQGEVRKRWNRKVGGRQPIRSALRQISGDECAWCGALVHDAALEVDHYLPNAHFPRLAYRWVNLLPSCGPCNKRKLEYHPPALMADSLADPAIKASAALDFEPSITLAKIVDRLVEPASEDPAAHLRFEPMLACYEARTPVGKRTIKRFFDEKGDAGRLVRLSLCVQKYVTGSISRTDLDDSLTKLIALVGCSFYIKAFEACWLALAPPTWSTAPSV
ncbi:MAG: HNH endonuclease [Myxococcales bacterium]|nr:HNH endonuclease [Myxococcales bacterium]